MAGHTLPLFSIRFSLVIFMELVLKSEGRVWLFVSLLKQRSSRTLPDRGKRDLYLFYSTASCRPIARSALTNGNPACHSPRPRKQFRFEETGRHRSTLGTIKLKSWILYGLPRGFNEVRIFNLFFALHDSQKLVLLLAWKSTSHTGVTNYCLLSWGLLAFL